MAEQKLKKCDLCREADLLTYVDGKTIFGPWGNLCINCHNKTGVGLGLGRGQQYAWSDEDGKYIKVGG